MDEYRFVKNSNKSIEGVDDAVEFKHLLVLLIYWINHLGRI